MKICENCNTEHNGVYGSGRFCNSKCARAFSTKNKRQDINNKLKGKKLTEEHKKKIGEGLRDKQHNLKSVNSILELSSRTITKILLRMNLGCSKCGWNESTCDLHHINGRKIENANNHNNISLLCPNCHRLVHTGKIKKEELVSLLQQIGDKWKDYYYWN